MRKALTVFEFTDDTSLIPRALDLGVNNSHATYDMVFLALAETRTLPLVTSDKRLATIAQRVLSSDVYNINKSADSLP